MADRLVREFEHAVMRAGQAVDAVSRLSERLTAEERVTAAVRLLRQLRPAERLRAIALAGPLPFDQVSQQISAPRIPERGVIDGEGPWAEPMRFEFALRGETGQVVFDSEAVR